MNDRRTPAAPYWGAARRLPPEISRERAISWIKDFPPTPPRANWRDWITPKTKWIMFISVVCSLVLWYSNVTVEAPLSLSDGSTGFPVATLPDLPGRDEAVAVVDSAPPSKAAVSRLPETVEGKDTLPPRAPLFPVTEEPVKSPDSEPSLFTVNDGEPLFAPNSSLPSVIGATGVEPTEARMPTLPTPYVPRKGWKLDTLELRSLEELDIRANATVHIYPATTDRIIIECSKVNKRYSTTRQSNGRVKVRLRALEEGAEKQFIVRVYAKKLERLKVSRDCEVFLPAENGPYVVSRGATLHFREK